MICYSLVQSNFSNSNSSSSSSNNIQDQCLIITDIYGVWEKGGVAGNTIPNPNTIKNK